MKTLALFVRHPECSTDCAYAMVHALSSDYQIRIFEEMELDDDDFYMKFD
jgi:esterase/lipase superfamily enzyme